MSSQTPDLYGGFKTGNTGQATTDPTSVDLYNMSDADRKELSALLKKLAIKYQLAVNIMTG
jgi:hypothetical protein